jgi:hypothetical protein
MNRGGVGKTGLILAMVAMLGIALSSAHWHAQGDPVSSTCAACTVAHQPMAVAPVDPLPAASAVGASDYACPGSPDSIQPPVSLERTRAPPV